MKPVAVFINETENFISRVVFDDSEGKFLVKSYRKCVLEPETVQTFDCKFHAIREAARRAFSFLG